MVRSRKSDRKGQHPRTAEPGRKKGPQLFSSRAQARAAGPATSKRRSAGKTKPGPAGPGKSGSAGGKEDAARRAKAAPPARRPAQSGHPSGAPTEGAREREDARPGSPGGRRRTAPAASKSAKGLWLYGRHAIEAALANPQRSCHRLLATAEALENLGARAERPGLEVVVVEREELDRRFGPDAVHQGQGLSVAPLPRLDLERACAPEAGSNLVLVLDQITDPHNLGAILRSAAAFEARAVVVPQRRSAELAGAAAKAASGALDLVPVVEVTNLARALDTLASLGYWRLGLDGDAQQAIDEAPDAQNLALVLGAEGSGLRRLVALHCDLAVRLPIAPAMESLNVSVAAGIALYALARRRPAP
jgi:23S rRNA (guanosine2251-2'-O)-methyltransferase